MNKLSTRTSAQRVEEGIGIRVEGLSKTFYLPRGNVRALDNVSLVSPSKKILTLLGPSGCGKTTLLRCIAGLEMPDSGEIQIAETVVFSSVRKIFLPPNKRDINMVFQSYAIWPHMTVFQNVAYPLEVKRLPKAEIKRRVKEILALVRLSGFEDRPATMLSGGQQQRVALARALVAQPKVLLFDEPLSNLDAKLREEARKELRTFLTELGISAIYVTHDRLEALTISDIIAVMKEGKIVEIGDPKTLYYESSNKFVLSFIGDVNLIPGMVVSIANGMATVKSSLGEMVCKVDYNLSVGTHGMIVLRPEIFELPPSDSQEGQNVIRGRVEQALFVGEAYEVTFKVGEIQLSVKMPPFINLQRGDVLALFVPPERCRFIPSDDENE